MYHNRYLGAAFLVAAQTDRLSFSLVFLFFPAGVVGSCSLLPALSLSLYDTPTPPLDEANLGGAHGTRSLL